MVRSTTRPKAALPPRRKTRGAANTAQQVYRHIPIIQVLGKMSKCGGGDSATRRMQGRMLELSPDTVRAMGNITLNALNDRIPLTSKQKAELKKREAQARKLAAPKGSLLVKRKIIQEGGFLPFLAGLIPAAASIISSLVNRGDK